MRALHYLAVRSLANSAIILSQRRVRAGHVNCASFLYKFNTFPSGWIKFNDCKCYADWLLDNSLGRTDGHLNRFFGQFDPAGESEDWKFWANRSAANEKIHSNLSCPKLYLGVAPGHVAIALQAMAPAIFESAPTMIKLPRFSKGAMRPDKVILYFESMTHLKNCVASLGNLIPAAIVRQAVPFTSQCLASPYLYIGIDPAKNGMGTYSESWRMLITQCLEEVIVAASPSINEYPIAFLERILARMGDLGFDPDQWAFV